MKAPHSYGNRSLDAARWPEEAVPRAPEAAQEATIMSYASASPERSMSCFFTAASLADFGRWPGMQQIVVEYLPAGTSFPDFSTPLIIDSQLATRPARPSRASGERITHRLFCRRFYARARLRHSDCKARAEVAGQLTDASIYRSHAATPSSAIVGLRYFRRGAAVALAHARRA